MDIPQELLTQVDMPWYMQIAAYKFEIMVAIGCSLAGYVAAQHFKSHPKVINNGWAIGSFNGLITGALSTWFLSNKYGWNESIQGGVLLALCSPIIVWLIFLLIDWKFPGASLKVGVYINPEVPLKAKDIIAVAIVGKRKDARKKNRTSEVWTDEQRKDITGPK